LALAAQEVQLAVDKAEQKATILPSQPLRLLVVDTAVDGEPVEESLVVLVALVAVAQKMAAQQEALVILHQHHRPKGLMVVQLLLVEPKAVLVVAAHLLLVQGELVQVLRNLVARVARELFQQ
jgi:hypothetical protein